jgi:predicted nucleic acid-binding protein
MNGPAMLDANVIVYADDSRDLSKATVAERLVGHLIKRGLAVVTPQVLGEYWLTATRKLVPPLSPDRAEGRIHEYRNFMRVIPYDSVIVAEAVRGERKYGLHYYDAQIWAAARLAAVDVVFSEDFNDGAEIEGVRFVNPFAPGFDLEAFLGA